VYTVLNQYGTAYTMAAQDATPYEREEVQMRTLYRGERNSSLMGGFRLPIWLLPVIVPHYQDTLGSIDIAS